jgi:DNA-binding NarL/FixJ family response regulator
MQVSVAFRQKLLSNSRSRELDVLRGIAKGQSNKVIAFSLNIVEHTVKNHIKSILSKLDVTDRTGAAIIAVRRGYVDL